MKTRIPLTGPAVWQGEDIRNSRRWIRDLPAAAVAEFDAALAAVNKKGLAWVQITRADFPLSSLDSLLACGYPERAALSGRARVGPRLSLRCSGDSGPAAPAKGLETGLAVAGRGQAASGGRVALEASASCRPVGVLAPCSLHRPCHVLHARPRWSAPGRLTIKMAARRRSELRRRPAARVAPPFIGNSRRGTRLLPAGGATLRVHYAPLAGA